MQLFPNFTCTHFYMKVNQVAFRGLLTFWTSIHFKYFFIWIKEVNCYSFLATAELKLKSRSTDLKNGRLCENMDVWRTKKITSTSKHCSCLSLSSSVYVLQYCVVRVGFCSKFVSLHWEKHPTFNWKTEFLFLIWTIYYFYYIPNKTLW